MVVQVDMNNHITVDKVPVTTLGSRYYRIERVLVDDYLMLESGAYQ